MLWNGKLKLGREEKRGGEGGKEMEKGEEGKEAGRETRRKKEKGERGTGRERKARKCSCVVFNLLLPKLLKPAPQSFYYFKNKRFSSQQNKANKPTRANIPYEKVLLFSLT